MNSRISRVYLVSDTVKSLFSSSGGVRAFVLLKSNVERIQFALSDTYRIVIHYGKKNILSIKRELRIILTHIRSTEVSVLEAGVGNRKQDSSKKDKGPAFMPVPSSHCHSVQNGPSGPGQTRTCSDIGPESTIQGKPSAECGALLNILSLEIQQIEYLIQTGDDRKRMKILKMLRAITMFGTVTPND